jgi:hypothetical protein
MPVSVANPGAGSAVVLAAMTPAAGLTISANDYVGPLSAVDGAGRATPTNVTPFVFPCPGRLKSFVVSATGATSAATNLTVYKATGNTNTPSYSATSAIVAVGNGNKYGGDATQFVDGVAGDLVLIRSDQNWSTSGLLVLAQFIPFTS